MRTTEPQPNRTAEPAASKREIRVALVLYGGVSLAVYENGVSRCFHDLVRGRGVFRTLLDLLDASAAVDVIAGASAGGINGLFLAAALESGSDFTQTARLWRSLADLGVLLGGAESAHGADSLLDGRYFHQELVHAFEGLCRPGAEPPMDSEIDVFIAGTDLDGHTRSYLDGLENEIRDKEHRVLFRLEHRPGRKALGFRRSKNEVDAREQARLLGTVARITASFPVAFSPIREGELSPSLREALCRVSRLTSPPDSPGRSFVDGGVLDNKPFGPALRAIFYRMPEGEVDRRLFYVEPDPVPFADVPRGAHPPLNVALSSLTSMPAHEGIADDLENLIEHNHRIQWLSRVRRAIEASAPADAPLPLAYRLARIETVVRSLVLEDDAVPSARDFPRNFRHAAMLHYLRQGLLERLGGPGGGVPESLDRLDSCDVVYQIRRAFHMLYRLYDDLDTAADRERTATALRLMGRAVKGLKVVLDSQLVLRDRLLEDGDPGPEAAGRVLDRFWRFMNTDAPWWRPLAGALDAEAVVSAFGTGDGAAFLPSGRLSDLARALKSPDLDSAAAGGADTILDRFAGAIRTIMVLHDGSAARFEAFDWSDRELYALEFASGVYELDVIEFVRISPADAQIGLSAGPPHEKISGDRMAHFAAFFRRDWRSNDLLQGRLDGICQIVRSLLDRPALERILACGRAPNKERMALDMPRSADAAISGVVEAWNGLTSAWSAGGGRWSEAVEGAAARFREALILAGHWQAFEEEIPAIYADLHYQEVKFGRARGLRGAGSGTHDTLIERDAELAATEDLQVLGKGDPRWQEYQRMRIGASAVTGHDGQVPNAVLGQYAALSYLKLWSIAHVSLGSHGGWLSRSSVRLLARTPVAFLHRVLTLVRSERSTAVALVALSAGILIGAAAVGFVAGLWQVFVIAVLLLLVGMALYLWLGGRPKRPSAAPGP